MNEQDPHSQAPAALPRRRRYPWILAGLALFLGAVLAAAPTLLSSPPLRSAAMSWYNGSIPGSVEFGDVSLSWLGPQSARGLIVRDPQGDPVLTLDMLTTDMALVDALRGRLSLGETRVRGLDVSLAFDADGDNNLAAALGGDPGDGRDQGGVVAPVTGNMILENGRVAITAPGIEPIALERLSAEVTTTALAEPIRFSAGGHSRQGKLEGGFEAAGQVKGMFTDGEPTPAAAVADLNASIRDLPVDALDQLFGMGGVLSAALGERATVDVAAAGGVDEQTLSIDARAPNGELQLAGTVSGGVFRLREPASARLSVTPALLDAFNARPAGAPPMRLAAPVPVRLEVPRLDLPVRDFNAAGAAVEATLTTDEPVRLTEITNIGDMVLDGLRVEAASPGLSERLRVSASGKPVVAGTPGKFELDADIAGLLGATGALQPGSMSVDARSSISGMPTSMLDTILKQDGLLVAAAGDRFALKLDADTGADGVIDITASLDAERLQARDIHLTAGAGFARAQAPRVQLTLTPELWQRLLGDGAAYRLTDTASLTVDVETLRLPLPGAAERLVPGHITAKATASAPSLALAETASGQPTRLQELNVRVDAADGLDDFVVQAMAGLLQPGGFLDRFGASPLDVNVEVATGLVDGFALKRTTGSLEAYSDGASIDLTAAVDAESLRLSLVQPAVFKINVTPAMAAAWQDRDAPALTLAQPVAVKGSLERLEIPLSPFSLAGLQASGRAAMEVDSASPARIESPAGVATLLDQAQASFAFNGADRGRAGLELEARVRTGNESGGMTLQADATNLLNARGMLAADAMSLEVNGALDQLPVALVDQLLALDGAAVATLGATANVEIDTTLERMQGPLSLTLHAANARADIKAALGERGLTLTEPLTAEVEPTPEFGSKVLAKVHPIFETTQRAERPIRFEMPADGVLIPIEDYEFRRVAVPRMTVDFGKIVLKSGWLLRGVIGLGQRLGKLDSVQKDEWVAWFTPGVMKIENGRILYTRRLDVLLAEKLHLATWGSADVAADRSELILAFMPGTMERVFSITVAGNDALRVPITGPLSDPAVDFKKAGADLARLRAQEEVSGESALASALLGAVTGKPGGGGPVPAPSVQPLPWTDQLEALDADPAQQQADRPGPHEKPSTEEQVIRGLIDMFGKPKTKE